MLMLRAAIWGMYSKSLRGSTKVLYNFGSQPGDGTAPRDFGGLALRGR
jgi:hypothetical protein